MIGADVARRPRSLAAFGRQNAARANWAKAKPETLRARIAARKSKFLRVHCRIKCVQNCYAVGGTVVFMNDR